MKGNPLLLSLGASLLIHAAAFGVYVWRGTLYHPAQLLHQDSPITLTLVAAPADDVAPPQRPAVAVVAPAPVIPPPPIVEKIKTDDLPLPVEKAHPVEAPQPPAPVPPPAPPSLPGDGSSSQPGADATTQTAPAGDQAAPDYLKNPDPVYPLVARRRHQEGLVLLAVKITAQGRATEITLKHSSGFPLLDDAALQAVREWEFVPARIGSIVVKSEIEVPVRFKLTD